MSCSYVSSNILRLKSRSRFHSALPSAFSRSQTEERSLYALRYSAVSSNVA